MDIYVYFLTIYNLMYNSKYYVSENMFRIV